MHLLIVVVTLQLVVHLLIFVVVTLNWIVDLLIVVGYWDEFMH